MSLAPGTISTNKKTQDIALLVKAAMLTQKGHQDWTKIQEYYRERNLIGHGKQWVQPLVIPSVGQEMHDILSRFNTR